MTSQLAARHPTQGMDEVLPVKVGESVLVQVVGIRPRKEVMGRRILHPILIMSILKDVKTRITITTKGLTRYASSLNINGVIARF